MTEDVALLQALIRNACVNDGRPESGQEFRSVETLSEYFGQAGEVFEPAPGRQSAVYRVKGRDPRAPALMMMGHLDVVPVNPAAWSHDPFVGEIADGFIWGRGAIDMLNLTSSMAVAFKPFLTGERERPPGDLVFLAVADEETAGGLGAARLVEERWDLVQCDYLLTEIAYPPIETTAGTAYPVSVGEKGAFWTVLRSRGTAGHGSTPFGKDNALEPLATAVSRLFSNPSPVLITEHWRGFVAGLGLDPQLAAALTDPDRVDWALDQLAASDPALAAYAHACTHLTVSPNVLSAGLKANVIPDQAHAEIDLRALPGMDRSDVDQYLRKTMGSAGDRIELTPVADHPATASDGSDRLWETIVDSIEDTTGSRRVIPTLMPAATDARFFRSKGIPCYGVGLFDQRIEFADFLTMFHGHDERVSVASVQATTRLLDRLLERWTAR
jgi:acetylornithine deacetylase/succinyl-diaminopimelate desuccinylase-like protein